MLNAPPNLDTPRLRLAPPVPDDAEAIFARYAADPEVTRFLSWPTHGGIDDTRAFIQFSMAEWARTGVGPYLIRARADARLMGSTGLSLDGNGDAVTGYVLARDEWGRGYATEALGAMVTLASALGLRSLGALCHPQHAASQRVLAKAGFERNAAWIGDAPFPNLDGRPHHQTWRFERRLPPQPATAEPSRSE